MFLLLTLNMQLPAGFTYLRCWRILFFYAELKIGRQFLVLLSFTMKSRNSHQRCSMKKVVLRNFTKFTGKHLRQSFRPATLLKKRLWHMCFPVNFVKFLRTPMAYYIFYMAYCIYVNIVGHGTPFFIEHLWWLLLNIIILWFHEHSFFKTK